MTTTTRYGLTGALILTIAWLAIAGCDGGAGEGDATVSGGDGGGSDGGVVTGGCTSPGSDCTTGNYCDVVTGKCKPGCSANGECGSGFCNMGTHQCGEPADGGTDGGKPDAEHDGGIDGGKPDGGGVASVILPGEGIDYKNGTAEHQIRVMTDDFGSMNTNLGAGTPNADLAWYISWPDALVDALFIDTNGDKAANAGDLLNRLILLDGFNGATAQGNGVGTARAGWTSEVGAPDYTSSLDAGDSMDLFFTRGLNILYAPGGAAKGLTIYKPTRVVPGQDIDWSNSKVFGIKSSVKSGTSFTTMENTLGTPDLVSTGTSGSVTTETRSYIGLGLSFVHADQAQGDVNTIAVYPPYFGKLQGTSLMLGSSHADVKAYFDKKYSEKSTPAGQTTMYYYELYQESVFLYNFAICLGFVYNSSDQLSSIVVGYPIKK